MKNKPGSQERAPEQPFVLPGHRVRIFIGAGDVVGKVGDKTIIRETQAKGISLFELAERSAARSKEMGRPVSKDTQEWLDVPEWSNEREKEEIQKFLRPNDDPFVARRLGCRLLLQGSPEAATALGFMARECLDQLQTAAESVYESEFYSAQASIAAEELARIISEACSKLNALARKRPKIFHGFTRKGYWKWPVMKSTYSQFGDDERALFAGLQLAKDLPLRLDSKAQWGRQLEDDAGRIAWALFWYVWHARSENNTWRMDYGQIGKLADALPSLDKRTALKWWNVAKTALLLSYPKPLDVPELAVLVKERKQRRFRSRLEEAILDKLKARFLSFARLPAKISPT